ncbi:hypothetical protein ACFL9T_07340 [Thermodesulfobacteriota bacterium]
MKNLYLLLSPRFLGFKKFFSGPRRENRKKAVIMGTVGILFWALMFVLSSRVLVYFQSVEVIGDLVAHHLLSMVLLTFFSLLIFSHIITALSNLYLSNDLELCHASPAALEEVFLSRAIYTVMDSSWMVVIFGMPIMMAYAYVYRPGPGYYFALCYLGLALIIIAASLAILFTMVLVAVFPAQRTRDLVVLLMILMVVALYLTLRFLRPERLVDPEAFFSVMQYLSALEAPGSPYLPSHWVSEALWGHLIGMKGKSHLFEVVFSWTTALALMVINVWVAGAIYFNGFSKSQEAKRRRKGSNFFLGFIRKLFTSPLGDDVASVVDKDIRTFFRDNSQWSQLLLLGALVIVYLYNFSVLPLDMSPVKVEFLQNEIAFLNMGLAGFVLSAVAVRFIFPAVSSEGGAFWIIRTSPLSLKKFLWGKFAFYLVPMLFLGEVLIVITNYLLDVSRFMMILSSATMFLAVFGIVALGVGFGALYPNFKYQNIAQVATGFGGVMYMITAAIFIALIIILEAGPVYLIFMADLRGKAITGFKWALIIVPFLFVLAITAFAVLKPMKMGLKTLRQYE